jgi:hypothetical protein
MELLSGQLRDIAPGWSPFLEGTTRCRFFSVLVLIRLSVPVPVAPRTTSRWGQINGIEDVNFRIAQRDFVGNEIFGWTELKQLSHSRGAEKEYVEKLRA